MYYLKHLAAAVYTIQVLLHHVYHVALSLKNGGKTRAVDTKELRQILVENGALVD